MLAPDEVYAARSARFAAEEAAAARRFDRVANLRLGAFLLAAACAAAGIWQRQPLLGLPAAGLLVAFAVLVRYHGRLGRRRRAAGMRRQVNDEGRSRVARDWGALPLRHEPLADPDHPYAADLDLLGRASLMHLLDTTATPAGQATLRAWLLAPAAPPRRWYVWAARLGPVLLWASVAAWASRLEPLPLWPLFLLANLALWIGLAPRVDQTLDRVRTQQTALSQCTEALELLAEAALAAPVLARLRERCSLDGVPAHLQVRRLGRLSELAVPVLAQLHIVAQVLFLWNVHVLLAVEGWQARSGRGVRGWLDAVGTFEALAALGALAHDNPGWASPEPVPSGGPLEARDLGHPLLPPAVRVDNDVTVGPPGTFLFVTGSNMAGKSTLLRAVGANVVLAQAGGPVCASSLRLPPLELWTSIRVVDSLEQGVSFFLAELRRLQRIVEAARKSGSHLCYLLDEVLQGTNTGERQVAARRVVRHLVGCGAIGVVTTHDLSLTATPELERVARAVHFTETVVADGAHPVMTFDYRLRPGVATSSNALRLMALVGLDLDDAGPT